ncbi:Ig-like domain-containing protein [bacterium]|nr:Ig-like domain-containing protein [bacterium]
MRTKKIIFLLLVIVFLSFTTGCLGGLFNNKPIIGSTPEDSAKVGIEYTYEVDATDPDADDVLTYSLTEKPDFMTINETGEVSWTPTEAQVGENQVTVAVSDGKVSVSKSFTITVEEALLDSIVVIPSEMSIYIGDSETLTSITAHYDNETEAEIELDSDDVSYNIDSTDIITVTSGVVTGVSEGTETITVSYTESYTGEDDITDTADIIVTVQEKPILDTIFVEPMRMIMYVGASQSITFITASYTNADDASIELSLAGYSSLDPAIATVNSSGVVTGVSVGETTVIVTYTEGGVTDIDTVEVTVTLMPI